MNQSDSFKQWMKKVDKALMRKCGLTHLDLGDQPWHDWYDNGTSPEEAAQECLVNEGFPAE